MKLMATVLICFCLTWYKVMVNYSRLTPIKTPLHDQNTTTALSRGFGVTPCLHFSLTHAQDEGTAGVSKEQPSLLTTNPSESSFTFHLLWGEKESRQKSLWFLEPSTFRNYSAKVTEPGFFQGSTFPLPAKSANKFSDCVLSAVNLPFSEFNTRFISLPQIYPCICLKPRN